MLAFGITLMIAGALLVAAGYWLIRFATGYAKYEEDKDNGCP